MSDEPAEIVMSGPSTMKLSEYALHVAKWRDEHAEEYGVVVKLGDFHVYGTEGDPPARMSFTVAGERWLEWCEAMNDASPVTGA